MILLLLLLWIPLIIVAIMSRRYSRSHLWRNTGIAFGMVVSPGTLGLYGLYFIGPIAAPLGIVGLPLHLLHGSPGYELAIHFGLVPLHTVVEGRMHVPIEAINGAIWATVYGLVGWCIDAWRKSRNNGQASAV
jgi:hypothetical protein